MQIMKRIFLLAVLVVGYAVSYAQTSCQIVAYKGVVEYRTTSTDWKRVHNNLTLLSIDSIRIHESSEVDIFYRNENHHYAAPCTSAVYVLLKKDKSKRASHFSIAGVLKEIQSGETEPIKMRQVGIGKSRDTLYEDYDLLADQLEWIGSQVANGAAIPPIKGISLIQIAHTDKEVEFELVNNTDRDYCMNVLHINKRTGTMSLCYVITDDVKEESCLVIPRGYVLGGLDTYFPRTEDDLYVLIALESPYNSMALDDELSYRKISENIRKVELNILYTR